MDFFGEFYHEEVDGKQFMVYHHPKYNPLQKHQSTSSKSKPDNYNHPFHHLFLCPTARWLEEHFKLNSYVLQLNSSPEYILSTTKNDDHPVLPLYWCKNKEFDDDGECEICRVSNFSTNYYFCEYHDRKYHKECVESPTKIKHPYHPEHFLQLFFYYSFDSYFTKCFICGERALYLIYYCTICQIFMHPICTMKPISFIIDKSKRHEHPLTFFPRQTSLTCNICGLLKKTEPTYVCLICNFVAHKDCMYFPHIIKISRHHHRISYISSLRSGELYCGVCRQSVDGDYGAYTCDKCSNYVVHSRCALGKDVWDGEELECVTEEDDITQDAGPFKMISGGVILYYLHDHHLRFEVNILYDENNLCQACILPIYEGNFYSCMECDFILHETCAMAPRRIQHALHPHPLKLKIINGYDCIAFQCNACNRSCGGFIYECCTRQCTYNLDVRCASISEPFDYKAHEHPLFFALDPVKKPICRVCKTECYKQLNCIRCNFVVCIKCATLPLKARYKYDKHFLKILCREEVCEKDWCEVCERDFEDTNTEVFYGCNECCTTFHIECLFGGDPYIKPGQICIVYGTKVQILGKSNISRPLCNYCKNRCQFKIFKSGYRITCSRKCMSKFSSNYFSIQ